MRCVGVLAAAVGLVAGLSAPAAAAPQRVIFHEHFTDVIDDFVVEDYCDVEGFDVPVHAVSSGQERLAFRGKDPAPYYSTNRRTVVTDTNPLTGRTVTWVDTIVDKDRKITANPDGTYTVEVLATGNGYVMDDTGTVIARNPGQIRYEILLAADGEFLEFLGLTKGSTGRSDEFDCDDFFEATAALP